MASVSTAQEAQAIPTTSTASQSSEHSAENTNGQVLAKGGISHVSSEHTLKVESPNGEFNLEKLVEQMMQGRDKNEASLRELGVVFRDLQTVGISAGASHQPTVGSLLNPKAIFEEIQEARHPHLRNILTGFEGVVKPGEMLLVLGSPGAGCSTFLKTLANHRSDYVAVNGEVHYDSITPEELKKHFRGDVQYCPEDDVHFPTLTVQQTINFAARMRTPRNRIGDQPRPQFSEVMSSTLVKMFGLSHARKTPIGDAMIRGISGGEKKRVSIAETLATRACITSWDSPTRGLDSSTALEYIQSMRLATDAMRLGTIISIYQAGESLYRHFDKVCVIYEGHMAYYGPADQAKDYFIEMGYIPANRQTTPDFLVAVTDPNARLPRDGITTQPRTASEFAEYFKKSKAGRDNRAEVDAYIAERVGKPELAQAYAQSVHAEFAKGSGQSNPFVLTVLQQIAAVTLRKAQITKGNKLIVALNAFTFAFQAIIIGSIFFQMSASTDTFFSRGGVLFFALLFSAMTAMAEIPALFWQRRIVHRHQRGALYHPFMEALAHTLIDIPITFVINVFFCLIFYFMTGLQRTAHQFFVFFLYSMLMAITMKSWFRGVAAAMKSEAAAHTVAGISVLALTIYTGYNVPKPSMIGALRWITYINPLRYGFESLMTNEFRTLNATCDTLVPGGPGYENVPLENKVCAVVGALPGQNYVEGARHLELSFGFKWSNNWMNLGIIIAFAVGFLSILLLFSQYVTTTSTDTTSTMYKRGSKRRNVSEANDEESGEKVAELNEKSPITPTVGKEVQPVRMTDTFTWQNINYSVPISGEPDRSLLEDVSGFVAPGKLTALMGESGAGKTTLLNVLANRVYYGNVSGVMLVNGQPLPIDFQSQTGYCQQMDTHEQTATVREALLFSAKLRQPPSVSLEEKEAYVEQCLQMCGLEDYADAIVGSLNVEHRKRTTIAVELAAKPRLLLFLDEPTSGLDSQSAWAIVSFLRGLADQGQAILCTIHQPSAELFQTFDRVLLLKKGGQTVYFGDIGASSTTLLQYFERNGGRRCDPSENPAEYMLEVIGAGATATTAYNWYDIWRTSPEATALKEELQTIHTDGRSRPAVQAELHTEFATTWFFQLKELFLRNMRSYWREPTYLVSKMVLNAVSGLFIGFTFFKAKNTIQGTQNKLFSIFLTTILSVPLASQLQVPYVRLRNIYEIRERPSRMYSWTALVTSQILIEMPWNVVASTLLFLTWYFTVGFPNDRAGYTYLLLGVLFPAYYTSIGQAVASMSPTAEIAALIFNLLFSFVLLFNGVFQPFRELGWWQWMYRLSPYTYLVEGLLGQGIGRQEAQCSPIEYVKIIPPAGQNCGAYMGPFMSFAGGYLTDPSATDECNFCSIHMTDQFLASGFNIFYDNRWRDIGITAAFIGFNILMTYILTYLFRIRTGSLIPGFLRRSKK